MSNEPQVIFIVYLIYFSIALRRLEIRKLSTDSNTQLEHESFLE